jgi:predicted amidohydrolase YtcJ
MSAAADIAVYQELMRKGKLKTRIYGCSPLSLHKRWENTGVQFAFGNAMLRIGCLKGFADGSLGSTTAWLFEPYLDSPKSTGLAGEEFPNFADEIAAAEKNGQQVIIHAIGDRANAEILSLYEKNNAKAGIRDRRFRIEHAQHLRDQEIPKFAANGVVASMQPIHLVDDGHWAFKRLDEKRLQGTYAFRSLLDSGARLAFGSDAPVAPLNPLLGIAAAVTRQTGDGKNPNGWIAKQKISVDEAVYGFTMGSAYAEFQENSKGSLELGKLADFIIVSDDLFTINVNKIRDASVLLTVMDGRVVYER